MSSSTLDAILNNSAERDHLYAEACTEGIIVHDNGTVVDANDQCLSLTGYSRNELVGQDVFQKIIAAESRDVATKHASAGDDSSYEIHINHKNGTCFPVLVHPRTLERDDHMIRIVTMSDITEQKELEQILRDQNDLVNEMSTPVIKLWGGVLLMPLIGVIDTVRAQQILEVLLEEIVASEAEVVILDVTGVPMIDTSVARHLIKTVDASKMLGAGVIITGFSPEAAQTLTQLNVDFGSLRTRGSLRAGVAEAFRLVGMTVSARTNRLN